MNTPLLQLHHNEQMEALRRDFAKLWVMELLPKLGTNDPRLIAAAQHEAWRKYRAERKIN